MILKKCSEHYDMLQEEAQEIMVETSETFQQEGGERG